MRTFEPPFSPMKRHGKLFEKILAEDNLQAALRTACRSNGRTSPAKRRAVAAVRAHPDEWAAKLRAFLSGDYRTSKYNTFPLYDPKLRFIYALPFVPDRLVHHALLNVLAPIWDSKFAPFSFACRKGYGQHRAGNLCSSYTRKYKYVAQFDVSQFYVSINHGVLKAVLRKKIKDTKVLAILDEIIDSISTRDKNLEILYRMKAQGFEHKDIDKEIRKLEVSKARDDGARAGVPVGSFTSQWFGNLVMNESDTYLTQTLGCHAVVRYCDDFLVFSNDKAFLQKVKEAERKFLWERLHLILSKAEVFPTAQGVDFCGYRYFPQGYVLLRKRTAKQQRRHLGEIRHGLASGAISKDEARCRLASMRGWLRWAQCHNWKKRHGFYALEKEIGIA